MVCIDMAVDYDHFTIEREGTTLTRTYYKDGQIVLVERETVSYEPHPFDKPSLNDWPEVIE